MLKKIVICFLSIIFVLCSIIIPDFNSFAEDVTIYYFASERDLTGYTVADFNTTYEDYLNNYDVVDGYLRSDIFSGNTPDSWKGSNFISLFSSSNTTGQEILTRLIYSINNDYTPSQNLNYKALEVAPVIVNGESVPQEDCKYLICWQQNTNNYNWNLEIYSIYVPSGVICFLEQGRLMASSNDVYISGITYDVQMPVNESYLTFTKYHDIATTKSYYATYDWDSDNVPDLYQYYITLNNWFYSDIPVYYCYENNSNGQGSFLNESPYFYGDYNARGGQTNSVGKYIISGLDDTGFIVDRRPAKQYGGSSADPNQIIKVDYDPNLFQGKLGFNWFNPSATLNYNQRVDNYYPYFNVNYRLNNYTNIHRSELSVVVNASIDLRLAWNDQNSNYDTDTFTSTSYDYNSEYLLINDDFLDHITIMATSNTSGWTNSYLRSSRSFNNITDLNKFTGDNLTQDIYYALKQGDGLNISDVGTYANFNITIYVKNNVTGVVSEKYNAQFDMLHNTISDNRNDIVSNDDQAFQQFVNSFDYRDDNGDLSPVDYANPVNNNNSNNSNAVVNITNPQYPYVLVDIPENEWINKTPNLKNMLTDFKTMLAETQEGSILTLLPATYSYLPAPVWNYILYGVGICVMIGIWHAITRR